MSESGTGSNYYDPNIEALHFLDLEKCCRK